MLSIVKNGLTSRTVFRKTVKIFRGGTVRSEPGMRRLASLELVVIYFHSQPEQADGEESEGSTCQCTEKSLHFSFSPLVFHM